MKKILVTGANGQLGQCLKELSNTFSLLDFVFVDRSVLDISNKNQIDSIFKEGNYDFCINCAAYTAVDKAEEDKAKAYTINAEGAKYIAEACNKYNLTLVHISTDFVFNGQSNIPYNEKMDTDPISVYGKTKLEGEKVIQQVQKNHYIIRTSWLYSEYGGNFVKTMLKLSEKRDKLNIINDQLGTPTYAKDLANAIIKIIESDKKAYGVYNYSNQGVASWYDFAKAIFEIKKVNIYTGSITTKEYPTPAKRPHYSVLNKEKIIQTFNLEIPYWRDSLKVCLDKINQENES